MIERQVIDEGPRVQDTQIGDIISVWEGDEDGEKSYVNYKVTAIYPHQVMALANRGKKRRFFGYGDLVVLGKESQCSEELRKRLKESAKCGARHTYTRTGQYGGE